MTDFNGDGADLFVTTGVFDVAKRTATIYYGAGNGTFPKKQVVNLGLSPTTVAAADLTGNGRVDLIAGSTNGPLRSRPASPAAAVGRRPRSPTPARTGRSRPQT